MNNQDALVIICLCMVAVFSAMLWLYFSNGERETVLVSPFNGGGAPVSDALYQVQIKDWQGQEFVFCPLFTGTADACQRLKKDLLKRGYSVTDVRVVQVV